MDDYEEVIPICDICGEPEDQDPTNGKEYNWNGETGNHLICEQYPEFARAVVRTVQELKDEGLVE